MSYRPRIAYSTLACPDWTFEQAADAARAYGYDGLELRVLDGAIVSADQAYDGRDRIARVLDSEGVELPIIDTSVRLTAPAAEVDELLARWCEVAAACRVPMLRVFGGNLPDGVGMAEATAHAAERLNTAARVAEANGTRVLLETHDAFRSASSVAAILESVPSPAIGIVWDIANSWQTGDTPEGVLELIGDRIVHAHVKDIGPTPDTPRAHVMLGAGQVPNREAIELLGKAGYEGWLSVEWEKKWHPEIPGPETALPHHIALLRSWLAEAGEVA